MAETPTKKGRNINDPEKNASLLESLLLKSPRVECAVFGCRSGAQAGRQFYPIPAQRERMTEWLDLINRRDLLNAASRRRAARVCSEHFAPNEPRVLPTLNLPTTNEYVKEPAPAVEVRGPDDEGDIVEIKFEPEEPLTTTFYDEPSGNQVRTNVDQPRPNIDRIRPNVAQQKPNDGQLRPNVDQLRPYNDQLKPDVGLRMRPNVDQPSPNVEKPKVAQGIRNIDKLRAIRKKVQKTKVNQVRSNVELPKQNANPLRLNVEAPEKNVGQTTPMILAMPNIYQITPNMSHLMPNIDQLRSHIESMRSNYQHDVRRVKTKVKLFKPKVNEGNVGSDLVMDLQSNVEVQTDSVEAFYRFATFSAVEHMDIPPPHRTHNTNNRSVHAQTTDDLTEYFTRGIKTKLEEELQQANKKYDLMRNPQIEKNQFLRGCDRYLDDKIANFVKSHAYFSAKFNGKTYPYIFKIFALNLYLQNPTAYKFVEDFFNFPSRRSLQQFIVPVKTGFNHSLFVSFKVKVDQMSVKGKMCAVCFDVLRLTESVYYDVANDYLCGMEEIDQVTGSQPAEYAAVIMVRGLYARWKQPISFAFMSKKRQYPELKTWLDKIIALLFDIGLNVKALVTNPDEELIDVSIKEQTYFEVNEHKIYIIYDVPLLIKNVRDELIHYDFHIKGTVAKWEHLVSAYNTDAQLEFRVMTNITDRHVRPDLESADDLKLATEVFSENVAAAMHFQVVARLQHREIKDTMLFIKKISNLIDILYSRTLDNAYRASSAQQRFLKDTMEYLQTLKIVDAEGNVYDSKFVPNLIISIKSIMALMSDQKKSNVNYLLTKNLSKDCMQTYFDESKRPTPIQFKRSFRKLFLVYLLKHTKSKATVEDMTGTLTKIADYVKTDLDTPIKAVPVQNLAVGVCDYNIHWPSNEYIAGYLIWKCLEHHPCEKMIAHISQHCLLNDSNADSLIQIYKSYNADNISRTDLPTPPVKYVWFVNSMEKKYKDYCRRSDRNNINFGQNIYATIPLHDYDWLPCTVYPLKYMKHLYIRLKIYSDCKKVNRVIRKKRNVGESMEIE